MQTGIYYTSALTKIRYLTRNSDISDPWPYRLIYWIENGGKTMRWKAEDWNSDEILYGCPDPLPESPDTDIEEDSYLPLPSPSLPKPSNEMMGGYLLEVWCTGSEFAIL
jgi:hypothetical protein